MSNPYGYTNYQQYSPVENNSTMSSTSPTFSNLSYVTPPESSSSNYSFHAPRLRYYLSKSFDIEDDMEFCPDIPDAGSGSSPTIKRFNPYTATFFSPGQDHQTSTQNSPPSDSSHPPRIHTPRVKKPLEIVNPHSKVRVGSPGINNK
ncbi:uncharacterized protein PRCAT00002005001 [Priceomyces carsonii]|uniref:uncharacterized protein n=1 Tax=Priceomyces carsonii TaxID=28549 RepID=UPI002ED7FB03|nr:unnamed protein product [Priceomyces carsonii]